MEILIIILLVIFFASVIINTSHSRYPDASKNYLWLLFGAHAVLTIVYIIYVYSSPSDSVAYYREALLAADWWGLWGTGTTFIKFFAWPFAHFFGLSYYAVMVIFSFFGFIALVLFYLASVENIRYTNASLGSFTIIEIIFLLPNTHFWSASLGKGSLILLGVGLFTYGLSRFNRRFVYIIFGSLITYFVRPHIFLTLVLSSMLGVLFTQSGLKWYLRWFIFIIAAVLFYLVSDKVVESTQTESLNLFTSSNLNQRAQALSSASSGVDISNYNLFFKLFTFWFRPLFVDSGGFIGFVSSFENAFYIYMLFVILQQSVRKWNEWNGWFRICLFIFLFGSVILCQITGNLGIAMRQKAQLMPFFFILFCKAVALKNQSIQE